MLAIDSTTDSSVDMMSLKEIDSLLMMETEPLRHLLKQPDSTSPEIRSLFLAMEELRTKYPRSWLLLYLLFFDGVSVDEIVAESNGKQTKDSIRKDKSRALKRLRDLMDDVL